MTTAPPRRFSADEVERATRRKSLGKARPRGTLPQLPDADDLERNCEWLTRAYKPPDGWTFEAFYRASQRRVDSCEIVFRRGAERHRFRFDEQADLIGTATKVRANVLGVTDGWAGMPLLTVSEISDFWAAHTRVGQILNRHDDRDETRKWIEQLLDVAAPLRGYTIAEAGPNRHDALMALRAHGEFKQPDAVQMGRGGEWTTRPVRFIDSETGEQWIRASEAFYFVKHVCGAEKVDRGKLTDRAAAIGVERSRFEHHAEPHPKAVLYRLTAALIEYAGDPPEAAQTSRNGKPERPLF